MKTNISTQVGPITPAQLTLDPAAFNAALLAGLPENKIDWTSDDHLALLNRLLPCVKDSTGTPATITLALMNVLKLICRPTEDVQREVLRQAFADAGYTITHETEELFKLMFSAPQFADFLARSENPKTGKPFIVKEKKRGTKKSAFSSVISALPAVTSATESSAETTGGNTESGKVDSTADTKVGEVSPEMEPAPLQPATTIATAAR